MRGLRSAIGTAPYGDKRPMLDSRVYRAAFVPVVFAIVIAAFALAERPRPIGTTLAPDAFDGRRAFATLNELARTYPRTRPGSPGDQALATRVENELRSAIEPEDERSGEVRVERVTGETIDGERTLTTVIGERPGRSSRRIVVVAHRDRAVEDDAGRLSGTAALVELARLYRGRPTRRTLSFVSLSGGTGGLAALRRLPEQLGGPVDAVLVLGDVATRREERPFVIPWSEQGGFAPMRLRRTVERALQLETDLDPGSPRALVQWARLAVPLTLTPQGALGEAGLSAVTIQASGERGVPADADVSRAQLQAFGRGTLRSISALDNGPDVPSGPREYIVFRGRILPRWTVSLIGALLIFPALVASVDGLARVRRRRQQVAVWLRWLVAAAAPFALAALVARLLGLAGMVPSLPGPVDPTAVPPETASTVLVALVVVLGLLMRAPLARALGARSLPRPDEVPGASAALGLAVTLLAILVWAFNPYTALLLVPAVHLWLLAAVPEVRLPRGVLVLMVLAGLLPFVLVGSYYAGQFDLSLGELAWQGVVLLAGGTVGPLGALVWSAILGCGVGALLIALRKRRVAAADGGDGSVSIRGPISYAGPGSLGGTESALRR
jgi:hypothetical protein